MRAWRSLRLLGQPEKKIRKPGGNTTTAGTEADGNDQAGDGELSGTEGFAEGQDLRLKSPKLQEYTDEAVKNMLQVTPAERTSLAFAAQDNYEPLEDASQLNGQKPYEVVVRDPDMIADSISFLMDRYFCSYLSREYQQAAISQAIDISYYSSSTDIIQADLLAGDEKEFVAVVSYRYIYAENSTEVFNEKIKDWGTIEKTEDGTWLYGQAAVHAKMTRDYVYELLDIAAGGKTLQAFSEKYPEKQQEYDSILTVLPDIINPRTGFHQWRSASGHSGRWEQLEECSVKYRPAVCERRPEGRSIEQCAGRQFPDQG